MKTWVVGITGASGAIYGVRLCEELLTRGVHLHLLITDAGWRVLHEELGYRKETLEIHLKSFQGTYEYHKIVDIGASIASGSYLIEGLVIIPCSMGSLSSIAHGSSGNLLERAADVMLKEGRKLIIVPRETPLHTIHLENMLTLTRMGVRMIPAMPAYYYGPQTIDDIVNFLVGKVLDNMGIEHNLFTRWGDKHE